MKYSNEKNFKYFKQFHNAFGPTATCHSISCCLVLVAAIIVPVSLVQTKANAEQRQFSTISENQNVDNTRRVRSPPQLDYSSIIYPDTSRTIAGRLERRSGGGGGYATSYQPPKTQLAISIERVKNPDDDDKYKKKKFPITWLRNQYPFNSYYNKKKQYKNLPNKHTSDPMSGAYSSQSYDVLDPNPSTWVRIPNRPTASIKFQKQSSSAFAAPPPTIASGPSGAAVTGLLPAQQALLPGAAHQGLVVPPQFNYVQQPLSTSLIPSRQVLQPAMSVAPMISRPQLIAGGGSMMESESQNDYSQSAAAPPAKSSYQAGGQQAAGDQQAGGFGGISLSFGNGRSISFGGGQGLTIGGRAGAISIGGKGGGSSDNTPAASGYSESANSAGYAATKGGAGHAASYGGGAGGGKSYGNSYASDDYVSKHPTMSVDVPRKGKKIIHLNTDMAPVKVRVHSSPRVKITTGSRDPLEKPSDEELEEEEEDIFEPPEPFPKRNATSANETDTMNNATMSNATNNANETTTISPMQLYQLNDGYNNYDYHQHHKVHEQHYHHHHHHHYQQQQQRQQQYHGDAYQHQPQATGYVGQPHHHHEGPPLYPNGSRPPPHPQQQPVPVPPPGQQHVPFDEPPHFVPINPYHHQQQPQYHVLDGPQQQPHPPMPRPPPSPAMQPIVQQQQQMEQPQPMQPPPPPPEMQQMQMQQPQPMPQQEMQPPPAEMQPPQQMQQNEPPPPPPPQEQQQPPPTDQQPAVNQWRQFSREARKQMNQFVPKQHELNQDQNPRFYNGGHSNSIADGPQQAPNQNDPVDFAASNQHENLARVSNVPAKLQQPQPGIKSPLSPPPPQHEQFNPTTIYQVSPQLNGANEMPTSGHQQQRHLQPNQAKQPQSSAQVPAGAGKVLHQHHHHQQQQQPQPGKSANQLQPQASTYHAAQSSHSPPQLSHNHYEAQRQRAYSASSSSGYSSGESAGGGAVKTYTFGSGGISTHYGPSGGGGGGGGYHSYSGYPSSVPSDGFDQKHYAAKVEKFEPDAHDKREKSKVVVFLKPRISIHMANSSTTTRRPKNQQRFLNVKTKPIFLNTTNGTHHNRSEEEFIDPDLAEPMDVPYSYGYGYGYGNSYKNGYYTTKGTTTSTTKKPKRKTTTTTTTSAPTTSSETESTTSSTSSSAETEGTTTAAPTTTSEDSSSSTTTEAFSSTTAESSSSASSESDKEVEGSSTSAATESSPVTTTTEAATTTTEATPTTSSSAEAEEEASSSASSTSSTPSDESTSTSESSAPEVDLMTAATEQAPLVTLPPVTTTTSTTTTTITTTTTPRPPVRARAMTNRPRSTTSTTTTSTSKAPTTTSKAPTTTSTTTTTTTTTSTTTTTTTPAPPETTVAAEQEETTTTTTTTPAPTTTSEAPVSPDDKLSANDADVIIEDLELDGDKLAESKSTTPEPTTTTTSTSTTTTEASAQQSKRSVGQRRSVSAPMLLNDELIDKLMKNKTLVGLMSSQLKRVIETEKMSELDKERIVRQVFEQMMEKKVDFSMSNVRLAVKRVSSSYRDAAEKQKKTNQELTTERPNKSRRRDRQRGSDSDKTFGRRATTSSLPVIDTALKLTKDSSAAGSSSSLSSAGGRDSSGNPIVVVLLPQEKAKAAKAAAAA